MGVLVPIGDAHPGGGRPCIYSEDALLDAALLQVFHSAGIDVVDAVAGGALKDAREIVKNAPRTDIFFAHRPNDGMKWEVGANRGDKFMSWLMRQKPMRIYIICRIDQLLESVGL
jgi:hypothetical protein